MKFNTISYFIGDAFKSLRRNKTISLASVITVLITFMVLGIFSLIAENANVAIIGVEEKVELKVYLKDDITLIDKREIEVQIREQPGVKEIEYESKEQAYINFEESMKESEGILQGYTLAYNPFQEAYIIKMEDPSYSKPISDAIKDLNGIDSVNSQQDLVDTVQKVVKAVRIVGIVLFSILIAVSIFLIMNTTKITVYSRRREVGIMKFVGATDWFIRWPFIIEGMVIAFFGAILSTVLLFILYKLAFTAIVSKLLMVDLVAPSYILTSLLWKFGLGSIVVGGLASYTALRKFLVV